MRPVVSRQDELTSWVATDPRPGDVRAVVRAISEKIILCGPTTKRELIKKLSSLTNEISQGLFIEMLESLVFIQSPNPLQLEDSALANFPNPSFPEIALSDQLHGAVKFHSKTMQVGESRESGFARLFGHLLPEATTVEIVDRFFAEKVAANSEVVAWVLEQISKHTDCPIRISTALPQSDSNQGRPGRELLNLADFESSLVGLKQKLNLSNPIHINLFQRVPHNRYFRLQFTGGAIYCSVDHGVDAFKDDPVSEPEPVKEITREDYSDISNSLVWRPGHKDGLYPYRNSSISQGFEIEIRVPRNFAYSRAA